MRNGDFQRNTSETEVQVELCLDGRGSYEINCDFCFSNTCSSKLPVIPVLI